MLPTRHVSSAPLYGLLEGFRTDLLFTARGNDEVHGTWPISTMSDLESYSAHVAGTVARLCLELVFCHTAEHVASEQRQYLIHAGTRMGVALQYVNIARDIIVDAKLHRVYLPTTWLAEVGLKPIDVVANPKDPRLIPLRDRLLDEANCIYREAKPAMQALPLEARAPMRAAVECYMEIGRTLQRKTYVQKSDRATVPIIRRLYIAWRAMNDG